MAVMPLVFIQQELSRGAAVPVLQDFTASPLPVNAVYPSGRFVSAKVRTFIDYLQSVCRVFRCWHPSPRHAVAPGNR
jgi:DNA-binding transcriptional LysR family regulator